MRFRAVQLSFPLKYGERMERKLSNSRCLAINFLSKSKRYFGARIRYAMVALFAVVKIVPSRTAEERVDRGHLIRTRQMVFSSTVLIRQGKLHPSGL